MFSWILPFSCFVYIEKMEIVNEKPVFVTKNEEIFLDWRTFVANLMVFKLD